MSVDRFFPETYEQSRTQFLDSTGRLKSHWKQINSDAFQIGGDPDNLIDWVYAEATESKQRVLVMTTGLHGIEGLIGAAVIQLFLEEMLLEIDSRWAGLLLLHALNPWGMRHGRKVNAQNVDLNRNFLCGDEPSPEEHNSDYRALDRLLNPARPLGSGWLETLLLPLGLIQVLLRIGPKRAFEAMLLGQYRYPKGVYFGGKEAQAETLFVKRLIPELTAEYRQVVLLDMHSGYGPMDQMCLVNSVLEPMSSEEIKERFGYPVVMAADPTEFYSIKGDMIDYFYRWFEENRPDSRFYGVAFEYGTLGESLSALFRSLRAIVWENQFHHFGTTRERMEGRVGEEFTALYAPTDRVWRMKALEDARHAFRGILVAEGFITETKG